MTKLPTYIETLQALAGCSECIRKSDCRRLEVHPQVIESVKRSEGCKDRRLKPK